MVTMTLCRNGMPVNSILVEPEHLPLLAEGETLADPKVVPYVPAPVADGETGV